LTLNPRGDTVRRWSEILSGIDFELWPGMYAPVCVLVI
jgi:hypothetical protein